MKKTIRGTLTNITLFKDKPEKAPEVISQLIVCKSEGQAREIRLTLRLAGADHRTRVISPRLSEIYGMVWERITVLPGVDLDQNIGGEGPLYQLLRDRQRTFGSRAQFVSLGP